MGEVGERGCGDNVGVAVGLGSSTTAILVLFILLVIITKSLWV
jgi:hypothetical protein